MKEQGPQKYDQFVANHALGSIHQTRVWGEFQAKLSGRGPFWCLTVEDAGTGDSHDHGQILASALVIRQALPFGKCWLYCPRGPLADYSNTQALRELFQKIRTLAQEQNAVFIRYDPALELKSSDLNCHSDFGFGNSVRAHSHYQPENTLILDLTASPEELLKQMKPKGRYNIKVAQKHGVKARKSDGNAADTSAFYNLLKLTTTRDAFAAHDQKYYENMLKILGPHAQLYLAEYQNKPLAGMIVTYFKDTATYYFGASSNEHRNVNAPALLQWQAIQDAKAAGCTEYDFLGIAPESPTRHLKFGFRNSPHPLRGVTDFKLKFGGTRVDYHPAQEIVYQPLWYALVKLIKKFRS